MANCTQSTRAHVRPSIVPYRPAYRARLATQRQKPIALCLVRGVWGGRRLVGRGTYAHSNLLVFFNWPSWPPTTLPFYRSTLCVSTRYPALRFPRPLTASPPSAHSMKSSISSSKRVSRTAWAAWPTFCAIDLM